MLDDWRIILHSPSSVAAVGVLHPLLFHLQPKECPPPSGHTVIMVGGEEGREEEPAGGVGAAGAAGAEVALGGGLRLSVMSQRGGGVVTIGCRREGGTAEGGRLLPEVSDEFLMSF